MLVTGHSVRDSVGQLHEMAFPHLCPGDGCAIGAYLVRLVQRGQYYGRSVSRERELAAAHEHREFWQGHHER